MAAPDFFEHAQSELDGHGGLCRLNNGNLWIIDPHAARDIEDRNFSDVPLPGGLFRRGSDAPVLWREIRQELQRVAVAQTAPKALAELTARMRREMLGAGQGAHDLTMLIELSVSSATIPLVLSTLKESEMKAVMRDHRAKITAFTRPEAAEAGGWRLRLRDVATEVAAGIAVRRALSRRRRGQPAEHRDCAEAILGLGDRLSKAQASYAVMTVLTAIAGAPGALAACLAFELTRQHAWRERMAAEHAALDTETFLAAPIKAAPTTFDFVREVQRLWSFPIVTTRASRKEIHCGAHTLEPGELYHLSAFFTHRSTLYWQQPETFDPSRWTRDAARNGAYVPFGWSARSCPGAAVGLLQLVLFARLMIHDVKLVLAPDACPYMRMAGTPLPGDFRGSICAA